MVLFCRCNNCVFACLTFLFVILGEGGQSRSVAVKATANGQFTFSKVLPGDYQLAATHPSWTLGGTKSKIPVSVGWKGVDVEESFKIKGIAIECAFELLCFVVTHHSCVKSYPFSLRNWECDCNDTIYVFD